MNFQRRLCLIPRHPCRAINPDIFPFLVSSQKVRQRFPNLYFRRFLSRICESRYQIIVHKILSWINSWQQKKTFTHQNRFGSPGLSVPDERMCSPRPEPTQCSLTNLSRGAYSTKPAWNDQSPTQRGFPAVISNVTLVCKIPGCSITDNWNTLITFYFNPWQKF